MTQESQATVQTHVPAQNVPIPTSVSAEAQAMLAMGPMLSGDYPALDDLDGWRKMVEERDRAVAAMIPTEHQDPNSRPTALDVNGVTVYVVTPPDRDENDHRVYMDIHGGAWTVGGGAVCEFFTLQTAAQVQAETWGVDYHMPPDHPYPAALDDCLTVYKRLLEDHRPEDIIVGGVSAGGNLAAALMLRIRDEGLPFPAAVVLGSPAVDFTEAGDTWKTNLGVDTVLTGSVKPTMLLYANGADLTDPYLSPLFGDLAAGFPPALLLSGTRDMLLSDTVRFHRALVAAGMPAELHVFEAYGHGGFLGMAPEDAEHARQIRAFVDKHWAHAVV